MKEKMLQNKKKIITVLGIVLLIVSAWWMFKYSPISKNFNNNAFETLLGSETETEYDSFSEKVILSEDDKLLKFDLASGKTEEATLVEQGSFGGFEGLPSLGFKDDGYLEISNILTSKDKKQAIVQVTSYEKKEENVVDPDAITDVKAYACQISEKKCQESDLLSKQYEGLDISLLKNNPFVWTKWDPKNNIIFGNFLTDVASPVFYVCNTSENKCNGIGEKEENSYFEVPFGAVSPTMEKFILIRRNNDPQIKAELYLYSTSDISQPLEKINVSALINNERDGFEKIASIAWGREGNRIAIGMDGGIFVLDMQKKGLSLIYTAPIDEENDYFWNSSELYLSPDESFIVFVDSDNWIEDEEDGESVNELKKINIDSQEVSTVYSARGLMMKL